MKKILVLMAAIVLTSCSQSKIAYIDVEDLMKEYEGTIALEESLKAKQEVIAKELDSIGAPFQQKVQQYYQNAQNMSAAKRAETEQALQQEQQMLQARQQQASQELQNENVAKSEVIMKRIDSLVADYAKANKFDLILGTSGNGTVMYGSDALNVTSNILEILNNDFAK
jgi:outer membrane protein